MCAIMQHSLHAKEDGARRQSNGEDTLHKSVYFLVCACFNDLVCWFVPFVAILLFCK